MTLNEIKDAVLSGKIVHWANALYVVTYGDKTKEFYIVCTDNKSTIGLTHRDGITMNGEPEDFYISGYKPIHR